MRKTTTGPEYHEHHGRLCYCDDPSAPPNGPGRPWRFFPGRPLRDGETVDEAYASDHEGAARIARDNERGDRIRRQNQSMAEGHLRRVTSEADRVRFGHDAEGEA